MTDPINPPHYTSHVSGVEAIELCEHMGFMLGNAVKYVWRAGLKPESLPINDLRKAAWYLKRAARSGHGLPINANMESLVGRVIDADQRAPIARLLRALFGGPVHFHGAWPADVVRASAVVDEEIARVESEAA